jgi:hypothetical protein
MAGCITFPRLIAYPWAFLTLPPCTSKLDSSDSAAEAACAKHTSCNTFVSPSVTNRGGLLCQSAHFNRANAAAPKRTVSVRA